MKDIDPYFKSQLYVEDPTSRKDGTHFPYSKPEERVHDRNYISEVRRIRTHNLFIVSPAYYHLTITTDYLVIIRVNTSTINLL